MGKIIVSYMLAVASIFCSIAPATALSTDSLRGKWLVFADGFRMNSLTSHHRVELGVFELRSDQTLIANFSYYDEGAALVPYISAFNHNTMTGLPYPSSCPIRGTFLTPQPTGVVSNGTGTWWVTNNVLHLRLGLALRKWLVQNEGQGAFTSWEILNADTGGYAINGVVYSSAVGRGYITSVSPVSGANLTPTLMQNIGHYDFWHLVPSQATWQYFATVWRPITAWAPLGNPNMLSNTNFPCVGSPTCANGRMQGCYDGILLNLDSNKNVFYSNDGHDFNCDGCFSEGPPINMNERGHIKRWYAIREGGVVRKIVFIEASTNGTFLSVGRWVDVP